METECTEFGKSETSENIHKSKSSFLIALKNTQNNAWK